ncbi:dipeptidase [Aquisediminimonas sediminicola]|uniref:dipeptidase n=1 Tax=Alteraquisediminimonas sediminicola TaxID=2676787 RepID=UPI001FEBE1BE|nr:dipeptidase [Aquisediminimonas sediminicola]
MMKKKLARAFMLVLAAQLPVHAQADAQADIGAGTKASARSVAIHRRLLTLDTHLDTPIHFTRPGWDFADRHQLASDPSQVDLPRMKRGALDGGFFVIYTPQGARTPEATAKARDHALVRAVEIHEMAARLHDKVALATRADDAASIAAQDMAVIYQSIENAYPLSGDLGLLDSFYALGVRMVGLVHFRNNDFGDSSTDPKGAEWHGLSPLGRQLVARANALGMILDASHASDDVLDQMLDLSKAPIILSHSGCEGVYDHPRNVDDPRLKRLAAKGGVIQINSFGAYLAASGPNPERDAALNQLNLQYGDHHAMTPTQTAQFVAARAAILRRYPGFERSYAQFAAHLIHALQVLGTDHVGIGLDWDGGGGVIGMADVTAIPRITQTLLDAGYTEGDIAKIWGGNVLRVMKAVEAVADTNSTPAS